MRVLLVCGTGEGPLKQKSRYSATTSCVAPLRRFLIEGSANCACKYLWYLPADLKDQVHSISPEINNIYGGPSLCNVADFEYSQTGCYDWAYDWEDSPEDSKLWLRSFPFAEIGNGDKLALDIGTDKDNPPVAYLSHNGEGGSCIIAKSFDQFLEDWEEINYIGPEIWMLYPFLDQASGLIDPTTSNKKKLNELLALRR